ncbi:MAG: hypothetical protein OEQ13_03495 [Acidobacteriota bacterium]|nr:hypothetical protein [Acidobacteriota bacterium]
MTPFQTYCKEQIEGLLGRYGVVPAFERLPGDPGRTGSLPDRSGHYRAEIRHSGSTIEVYLYLEEAGFKTDRNWYVFERHRYGDAAGLVSALTRELETQLGS